MRETTDFCPRGDPFCHLVIRTQLALGHQGKDRKAVPSESSTYKPVPLPIIGVADSDVRISGQRRVICVETFNIVCATEF